MQSVGRTDVFLMTVLPSSAPVPSSNNVPGFHVFGLHEMEGRGLYEDFVEAVHQADLVSQSCYMSGGVTDLLLHTVIPLLLLGEGEVQQGLNIGDSRLGHHLLRPPPWLTLR